MILFDSIRSQISKFPAQRPETADEATLEGFRHAQRLAYSCAVEVGRELREGWSEKRTAELMDTWLRDHGVRSFFHHSFAWFGERSRFDGIADGPRGYRAFLPRKERLFRGDEPVILDTAPLVEGFAADIGFSFSKVDHAGLHDARSLLLDLRSWIPGLFEQGVRPSEIWKQVHDRLQSVGYDNCHRKYPLQALGHRLHVTPLSRLPGITLPFSLQAYWSLISRGLFPEVLSPWHEGSLDGLWAIEPHLGGTGFGAKFEEILVVSNGRAEWLDESVPHKNLPEGFF